MAVTIRIPEATHAVARRLAQDSNRSIGEIISAAVAQYEEERWWEEVNAAYARLRADERESAAFDAEMALWDTALMDGLAEWPYEGIEELRATIDRETAP